jgi:hypothetical protein
MDIIVEETDAEPVEMGSLKAGTLFEYQEAVFMKIDSDNSSRINVVLLTTGVLSRVDPRTAVYVPKAHIVITRGAPPVKSVSSGKYVGDVNRRIVEEQQRQAKAGTFYDDIG